MNRRLHHWNRIKFSREGVNSFDLRRTEFRNLCLSFLWIQEDVKPTPVGDDAPQPTEREINLRQSWQEEWPLQHIQRRKQTSLKKLSNLKFNQ